MSASSRGSRLAYVVAYGVATVGGALGFLGATGAATAAGGKAHAALFTGVLIALYQLSGALAAPRVPRLCRDMSPRVAFATVQAASAGMWMGGGVALLLGAPTMPTLLVAVVPVGAANGLMTVLRPMLAQGYAGRGTMSGAIANMFVVIGVSWGVGSLLGGWLLSNLALAWGLVANGVLALTLAATVAWVAPTVEPAVASVASRVGRSAWSPLRGNRTLRWAAVLGVTGTMLIAPIAALVVPITHAFRQDRPLSGAGLLMASWSIGQLCSPLVVRRLAERRDQLSAGAAATLLCGGTLLAMAAVSVILAHVVGELAIWMAIGTVFGATRFAASALYLGAAAESGPADDAAASLATMTFLSLVAAPVGVLVCGALLGQVSAEAVVLACGWATVAVAGVVLGCARRPLPSGRHGRQQRA